METGGCWNTITGDCSKGTGAAAAQQEQEMAGSRFIMTAEAQWISAAQGQETAVVQSKKQAFSGLIVG